MNLFNSKISVGIIILICVVLPILKFGHSNDSSIIDNIEITSEKLKNDKLGLLEDAWNWGMKKIFNNENKKVKPLTASEKFLNKIYTGFNFGLSALGATKETINNIKFNLYNTSLMSAAVILFLLTLQFCLNLSTKLRLKYLGFTGLLATLSLVVMIGSSANENITESLIKGWLPFIVLQSFIIFSTQKAAKKKNVEFKIDFRTTK